MFEKEILGGLAAFIGLIGNVPYIIGILKGQIKPHVFSWGMWTLITGIAMVAQWSDGAGAGMWVMSVTFVICFFVAILAFKVGKKSDITLTDWLALFSVILAIPVWCVTQEPLTAVIMISMIDFIATYPSIRKGYHKPWDEGVSAYFFANLKFGLSLFALENFTFVTALYPASIIVVNSVLIVIVLARRRIVTRETAL